jgi:hypothetical protein
MSNLAEDYPHGGRPFCTLLHASYRTTGAFRGIGLLIIVACCEGSDSARAAKEHRARVRAGPKRLT